MSLAESIAALTVELQKLFQEKEPTTFEIAQILDARITPFSGEDGVLFISWLEEFTDILTRYNVRVEHGKALLPLYLTGEAKEKYHSIQNAHLKSWDALTTELATLCKDKYAIEQAKEKLLDMKQGTQTVREYAKEIRDTCKVAFQGNPKDYMEKQMIDFFIHGLDVGIKKYLRLQQKTTSFYETVGFAEREAQIQKCEKEELERESMMTTARRATGKMETAAMDSQTTLKMALMTKKMRNYNNWEGEHDGWNPSVGQYFPKHT